MKNIFLFSFLFLISVSISGQKLTGIVVDSLSNEKIVGATIFLPEIGHGVLVNEKGEFVIQNFANNKIMLQISMVGYKTRLLTLDTKTQNNVIIALEQSHTALEEVVVSSIQGKLQTENILLIEKKELKELKQNAPTSLAEAITQIAGVEQQSTGTGIGKPIIRGLTGNRVVTYAQDMRIENQQWGDEHGLGVGDVGIERVEVVKGPASLLYGSDALGGVLFFVDERYTELNNVEGFAQTSYQSNSLGSFNNVGLKFHKNNIKLNVFGGFTSNADYKTPNLGRVFNSRFDEKNVKIALGFSKKQWITNLKYSFLENNFGITEADSLFSNTKSRALTLPFQNITNHNISWVNTFFLSNSKINAVIGFTDNNRKEFANNADTPNLNMVLRTLSYNLKWYVPLKNTRLDFVFGSQGMYQTNTNFGIESLIPDATTTDAGIFSILNLDLNALKLQAGLRFDVRNIKSQFQVNGSDTLFNALERQFVNPNFSIGGVYSLGKINLRANLSKGFRTPNTSELLSNGIHEGTNQYLIGSQALKSENATQLDFTIDYNDEHFGIEVSPFVNRISNFIFLEPTNRIIEETPVYVYTQKNAILYGGEIGVHFHPHQIHWLHLESNISSVFAQDDSKNALPLIPATRINTNIRAEFSGSRKLQIKNIFLNQIYKFSQDRIGLFETQSTDYQIFNAGINLEIKTKNKPLELMFAVKNLLNRTYIDHLSRLKTLNVPNQGINFVIGLTYRFSHRLLNE